MNKQKPNLIKFYVLKWYECFKELLLDCSRCRMYMWTLTELLGVCRKQWIKWQRAVYWEMERWWNLMLIRLLIVSGFVCSQLF